MGGPVGFALVVVTVGPQREAVLDQIAQLKRTLQTLDYKVWYYETAKAAGTCDIHKQLTESDIPDQFRCGYRCSKDPAEERKPMNP